MTKIHACICVIISRPKLLEVMMKVVFKIFIFIFIVINFQSCEKPFSTEFRVKETNYKTKNVVVVIIDGPRYSETWGHPEKKHIPYLANELAPKGIINQEFYNFGNTKTISGHTASITGVYEIMNNNGLQYPSYPSIMQYWLAATQENPSKAWIIASKKKLKILGNCSNVDWRNNYLPMTDAVDRPDVETFARVKEVMTVHEPNLVFINLSGADLAGHGGKWDSYIENILITDSLLYEIVNLVDSLPNYKNETTVIMTNDHGRHLDGIGTGFKDHGDKCHGCTHINFFAYGPDFHSNIVLDNILREQIDVVPTVGHLLGFEMDHPQGKVMTELFK